MDHLAYSDVLASILPKTERGDDTKKITPIEHKLRFFVSPRDWPICKPKLEKIIFFHGIPQTVASSRLGQAGIEFLMISTTINGIRIASLCLIAYWLVLFTGTHLPRVRLPQMTGANDDKILHVVAFAGLSFLLAWAIPTKITDRFRNVRLAFLAAIFYAAVDELTQIPVGRTADWKDLIADLIGAVVGVIAYCIARELLWRIKPIDSPTHPTTADRETAQPNVSLHSPASR